MNDMFKEIISKICNELEIKVTFLSDNWATILEKDNKIHYITGYQFDLNNHGIGNMMDDKGMFHDLLNYKNIPVIEQHIILPNYNQNEVLNYFTNHNEKIIVKGNVGNAGKEVFLVTNKAELFVVIDKLFLKEYSISLCPYYHIKNEYRVIILNNEVRTMFGKIKPTVIGNGEKTIKELAFEFNDYYVNHQDKINNPDYIPAMDEKVEIGFKFNLSSGAKTFTNIDPVLKEKITQLALRVTKELNISFASIDIINTENNELLVMEANSGVTMNSYILQNKDAYDIAYNIYKDAIKQMFNIVN